MEIGQNYTEFVAGMRCVDTGDWIKLLQCPECGQLWRVDAWDKYQTLYASKLSTPEGWKLTDMVSLIKKRMVENHGGADTSPCLAKGCKHFALKGRAYCVDHFYETGARA
ncbi:metal-binding protein [Rugamonas brunnea]|uniref:metal-binding protein n=1 Tax=Rugamonas brunnea TaxID=2758569 RepID=UPI0015F4F8E1|nr:metal-binding protein [Rugamonas brunnea]